MAESLNERVEAMRLAKIAKDEREAAQSSAEVRALREFVKLMRVNGAKPDHVFSMVVRTSVSFTGVNRIDARFAAVRTGYVLRSTSSEWDTRDSVTMVSSDGELFGASTIHPPVAGLTKTMVSGSKYKEETTVHTDGELHSTFYARQQLALVLRPDFVPEPPRLDPQFDHYAYSAALYLGVPL